MMKLNKHECETKFNCFEIKVNHAKRIVIVPNVQHLMIAGQLGCFSHIERNIDQSSKCRPHLHQRSLSSLEI